MEKFLRRFESFMDDFEIRKKLFILYIVCVILPFIRNELNSNMIWKILQMQFNIISQTQLTMHLELPEIYT